MMTTHNDPTMSLPSWPPSLTPEQQASLLEFSVDWALSHSLVLRPLDHSTLSAIHAPFSLLPTPFPRSAFHKALALQRAYNDLYVQLASTPDFIHAVLGPVAQVDPFQGQLYSIYQQTHQQRQTTLGLFRSDYLLHADDGQPKQVEFNTVSSSFGALSSQVSKMHRDAVRARLIQHERLKEDNVPVNEATERLADGLAAAHKAFGVKDSVVLMVVQAGERNAFDQRLLEWSLLDRSGIRVVRRTFQELVDLPLDADRHLIIDGTPISVIYYRAGYAPTDYPTQREWDTRLNLERSTAIKCPSVGLQLAGAKKVQQVLASDHTLLQRFLSSEYQCQIQALRDTFMGIWPLDDSPEGQAALKLAYAEPERFVLKPQREGGGNNVYRQSIPPILDAMRARNPKEVEGYILMELIHPPPMENIMVRAGTGQGVQGEVVSELGTYGVALYREREDGTGAEVQVNEGKGHLLRTKGKEDDEGGVAVGFSVIDSPLLVD